MKTKSWNPAILMGILLGASLGGIVALIIVRRSKEGNRFGFREVPWRDLIGLIGPIVALGRQLLAMARREVSRPDTG